MKSVTVSINRYIRSRKKRKELARADAVGPGQSPSATSKDSRRPVRSAPAEASNQTVVRQDAGKGGGYAGNGGLRRTKNDRPEGGGNGSKGDAE